MPTNYIERAENAFKTMETKWAGDLPLESLQALQKLRRAWDVRLILDQGGSSLHSVHGKRQCFLSGVLVADQSQ
jgi:hypothetical protein